MLIDDFTSGKKRNDKLVVTPPPSQSLHLDTSQGSSSASGPFAMIEDTDMLPKPQQNSQPVNPEPSAGQGGSTGKWFSRHKPSKKVLILAAAGVLVVLGGGTVIARKILNKQPTEPTALVQPTPTASPTPTPAPTTEASRLTGVEVPIELNKRNITGIMIENSLDARPQAGLLEAGVVFEAIAEGGITRFLALYQEGKPNRIGPVRSVRPYYLDWLMPFDATIAHVGGSYDALQQIKSFGLKDLDQFQNAGFYERISEREAPHNVYTSSGRLDELTIAKGYTTSNFTPWLRKKAAPSATPNATFIDFDISGPSFNVHYDYDAAHNNYKRNEGGKPHQDEKSAAQLTPSVVVALVIPFKNITASDGYRSDYITSGQGAMYVFQDGTMTKGTWTKADRKSKYTFIDAEGKELALNPGQTWFTAVENDAAVSYK